MKRGVNIFEGVDVNNIDEGIYYLTIATNAPVSYGILLQVDRDVNVKFQLIMNTGSLYVRSRNSSGWSKWYKTDLTQVD